MQTFLPDVSYSLYHKNRERIIWISSLLVLTVLKTFLQLDKTKQTMLYLGLKVPITIFDNHLELSLFSNGRKSLKVANN